MKILDGMNVRVQGPSEVRDRLKLVKRSTVDDRPSGTVGLLGGGVIGGGWAARFLLHGADVRLYDPDPDAPRKVGEVVANARRALPRLLAAPLPDEGELTFVATPEEAVEGATFVQESAPERLDVKQHLLARADAAVDESVVIASSTSGLLPTLPPGGHAPTRSASSSAIRSTRSTCCRSSRSSPAPARRRAPSPAPPRSTAASACGRSCSTREIDGFVADRLLEALWREALWLVDGGVATVSQIDDAIRFGAGLRWSAMGTFLVYRMAGGEAGMRHFMEPVRPDPAVAVDASSPTSPS